MKFVEHKQQTAADLREVCKHLEERAKAIDEGDMSVMDKLLDDEWPLWGQMLMLRCAHREERVAAARESESETE